MYTFVAIRNYAQPAAYVRIIIQAQLHAIATASVPVQCEAHAGCGYTVYISTNK